MLKEPLKSCVIVCSEYVFLNGKTKKAENSQGHKGTIIHLFNLFLFSHYCFNHHCMFWNVTMTEPPPISDQCVRHDTSTHTTSRVIV